MCSGGKLPSVDCMTYANLRSAADSAGAVPFRWPHIAFRRTLADLWLGCVAAVRAAVAASDNRRTRQYPPLRTEFMEEAAMAREMYRL
jgi:hypothetical protein